jgi:hypothetical protein
VTEAKTAAAISSSESSFARRLKKARNWPRGSSGARWMFSASESSSARISVAVSCTTQGTGAFFARRFCLTSSSSAGSGERGAQIQAGVFPRAKRLWRGAHGSLHCGQV